MRRVIAIGFAGFINNAVATTYINCDFNSPPSSESGGGVYSCNIGSMTLYFGSNLSGQVFDHDPTGSWDGSGAAKFYSHIAAQSYTNSYRLLNPSSLGSTARQNTRWVMKYQNPAEIGGKWHEGTDGSWRTWLGFTDRGCGLVGSYMPEIAYNSTLWITHGGGYSSGCGYQWCANPSTWGSQISSCTIHEPDGFWLSNYTGQWIAIEVERTSTGGYKVYTWTRDGAFNGAFYSIDTTFSASLTTHFVGAYLEGNQTGQAFWIDDVVYADTYIGPPAGFVTGTTPTTTLARPANLRTTP